jgi:two-component system sensor histidine kinase YesM
VENAIRHGLGLKKGQGTIQIIVWQDEKLLYVKVADDGVGMSPEQVAKILIDAPEQQPGGNGIGLMNIHRRIQRFYGEGYGLKVESVLGQGTQVTIRLPIHCNKGRQT